MTEQERSRRVAEQAREATWRGDSFLRDAFLGRLRLDLIESLSLSEPDRPEFRVFYTRFKEFLLTHVDPVAIDETGQYPPHVVHGLADLGAFGLKIPREYGGLGFTHAEYVRVMELCGSYDANLTALLSAHQSIGVPQPIKLFGTADQKRRFLPRCARGAISAFALTEPAVGSDPARLGTRGIWSADGAECVLNGQKLWCTNGTLAELIVVMARDPATDRINAFVVEMSSPGVRVKHRCHFMGLRALANAVLDLRDVRVPRENLIGGEGEGLKIALTTLNTGRLSLPAATAGMAKRCTEIVRKWASAREQWGRPIGEHEAVAHMNADIATTTFVMDSVAKAAGELADKAGIDIRLEAAAAKEWNTVRAWEVVDTALQVRCGRGYETERSLAARGEPPVGIERALRDCRVNLIFEGSSEIMHLFMAREAVDKHLQVAGSLVDPAASLRDRLRALPRIAWFYAWWYPSRWIGWGRWPRYRRYGALARHLRFADRACRKLARSIFHGMIVYRAKLERKQAFLFRTVDIALELFALTVTTYRAELLRRQGSARAEAATELAQLAARQSRRRMRRLFSDLWRNDDAEKYTLGRRLLEGRYRWIEDGAVPVPYGVAELTPTSLADEFEPGAANGHPSEPPPVPEPYPPQPPAGTSSA
jgi:alkylation response protein AidB-like acyl-CoA dehydrogenase